MTPTEAHAQHVATILHEVGGHALTARSLGYSVLTVVTRRVAGAESLGGMCHELRPDRTGLWRAIDDATILLAGQIAETLLAEQVPAGYWTTAVDHDDEELAAEVLVAALAAEHTALDAEVLFNIATSSDRRLNDAEKAAFVAQAAAGEEAEAMLAFCAARARRIVAENAALAVALVPDILPRPVLSGTELESLIAALEGAHRA